MPYQETYKEPQTTRAPMRFMDLESVVDLEVEYPLFKVGSSTSASFDADYRIVGTKLIDISSGITNEVDTIRSLIDIGSILFKDSRDMLPDELAAMRSYVKAKYKKIQK